MEQKIKVEVTAANDQWPKLRPYGLIDCPVGTMYYVTEFHGSVTVWQNIKPCGIKIGEKEVNGVFFDGRLCFNDLDEFCHWWLNPQPVKAEAIRVEIGTLNVGDFFMDSYGTLFRVLKKNATTEKTYVVESARQSDGSVWIAMSDSLGTPFKGTVTITVE